MESHGGMERKVPLTSSWPTGQGRIQIVPRRWLLLLLRATARPPLCSGDSNRASLPRCREQKCNMMSKYEGSGCVLDSPACSPEFDFCHRGAPVMMPRGILDDDHHRFDSWKWCVRVQGPKQLHILVILEFTYMNMTRLKKKIRVFLWNGQSHILPIKVTSTKYLWNTTGVYVAGMVFHLSWMNGYKTALLQSLHRNNSFQLWSSFRTESGETVKNSQKQLNTDSPNSYRKKKTSQFRMQYCKSLCLWGKF